MSNQGFGPNGIAKDSNAAKMQAETGDVKKDFGLTNAQSAGVRGFDVGFGTGGGSINLKLISARVEPELRLSFSNYFDLILISFSYTSQIVFLVLTIEMFLFQFC